MLATFHLSTSDLLQNHPPAFPSANPCGSAVRTRERGLQDGLIIGVPDISCIFMHNIAPVVFDGWTDGLFALL